MAATFHINEKELARAKEARTPERGAGCRATRNTETPAEFDSFCPTLSGNQGPIIIPTWMDGWMDGWMDVPRYLKKYKKKGGSGGTQEAECCARGLAPYEPGTKDLFRGFGFLWTFQHAKGPSGAATLPGRPKGPSGAKGWSVRTIRADGDDPSRAIRGYNLPRDSFQDSFATPWHPVVNSLQGIAKFLRDAGWTLPSTGRFPTFFMDNPGSANWGILGILGRFFRINKGQLSRGFFQIAPCLAARPKGQSEDTGRGGEGVHFIFFNEDFILGVTMQLFSGHSTWP